MILRTERPFLVLYEVEKDRPGRRMKKEREVQRQGLAIFMSNGACMIDCRYRLAFSLPMFMLLKWTRFCKTRRRRNNRAVSRRAR